MLVYQRVAYTYNVVKIIINYPPVITIFMGSINHSQMGGLWHCFNHITSPIWGFPSMGDPPKVDSLEWKIPSKNG